MTGDLQNPDKITVVQIAPAVRAAMGRSVWVVAGIRDG